MYNIQNVRLILILMWTSTNQCSTDQRRTDSLPGSTPTGVYTPCPTLCAGVKPSQRHKLI